MLFSIPIGVGTISVWGGGGGGHNIFCPNFHLCPKSRICLGNAFFPHMRGGGGGGGEGGGEQLFWSDCVWDTTEGEGVGGDTVGTFWKFGY